MNARSFEPRVFGVVFAGGRSERMGRSKALLPWPGHPGRGPAGVGAAATLRTKEGSLLARGACTLAPLCECVEVASGEGAGEVEREAERLGLRAFRDRMRGAGPLSGLVAALDRAWELGLDGVLALACDMPFVGAETLTPLLDAARRGCDAALWRIDGVDQPLCAYYARSVRSGAAAALEGGARRLVAALDFGEKGAPLRIERIAADENSSERLMNVNTPADYDLALRRIDDAEGRPAPGPRGPDRP